MKSFKIVVILAVVSAFGAGCREAGDAGRPADESYDRGANPAGAEHEHGRIQVPASRQRDWGIVLETASREKPESRISLPGVVSLDRNRTAQVTSPVSGRVVSLAVDLGSRVRKGQVLFTVDSPEFARVQAEFLEARAEFQYGMREFERAAELFREDALEEKEYLRREAVRDKWAVTAGALESTLHAFGVDEGQVETLLRLCEKTDGAENLCRLADPRLAVRSPISGRVIQRDVVLGKYATPDQVLLTVSDLETVWAVLDAHERDLPKITFQSRIVVRTSLYPEKQFPGKIAYLGDVVDEKLRTVPVRVEVANPGGLLKANMYIEAEVAGPGTETPVLTVPAAAIQTIEGEKAVFVPAGGEVFQIRHVRPGRRIGNRIEIVEGLRETERFVSGGAFNLKAELSKRTFGHAHVH
jgi:cobalt-zinc-cadmium efflux system membrane fusion protein